MKEARSAWRCWRSCTGDGVMPLRRGRRRSSPVKDARASLRPALAGAGRDVAVIARAITPVLAGHRSVEDEDAGVLPVLLATVALELARCGVTEYGMRQAPHS